MNIGNINIAQFNIQFSGLLGPVLIVMSDSSRKEGPEDKILNNLYSHKALHNKQSRKKSLALHLIYYKMVVLSLLFLLGMPDVEFWLTADADTYTKYAHIFFFHAIVENIKSLL